LGRDRSHALDFGDAIMTTDLKRKSAAVEFAIGKTRVRLAGVCKGSGMIGPRLGLAPHATMLAYLTCDAAIAPPLLRRALAEAAEQSFNAVTVDDQTSTNDTAAILCSGDSGAKIAGGAALRTFAKALTQVCQDLAKQIAADGEGATKLVTIRVHQAATPAAAAGIARSIANSPLVKCAMNGNDPNWGRILCAAGFTPFAFDAQKCVLRLQETIVFRHGVPASFNAPRLSRALHAKEVRVDLACGLGTGDATVWTCDLSKEYVTINADYHT
jgi:glutamate N-acetyltransferase/amino-acid N-acetyltransferase